MTGPEGRVLLILVIIVMYVVMAAVVALKRRLDRLREETKEARRRAEQLKYEIQDRIIPMLQQMTDANERIGRWLGAHRHAEAGPPPEREDDDEIVVAHITAAAMRNDLLELKAELEQSTSPVEAG
jgi:Mg2+ and Co2+ transporter CorA